MQPTQPTNTKPKIFTKPQTDGENRDRHRKMTRHIFSKIFSPKDGKTTLFEPITINTIFNISPSKYLLTNLWKSVFRCSIGCPASTDGKKTCLKQQSMNQLLKKPILTKLKKQWKHSYIFRQPPENVNYQSHFNDPQYKRELFEMSIFTNERKLEIRHICLKSLK